MSRIMMHCLDNPKHSLPECLLAGSSARHLADTLRIVKHCIIRALWIIFLSRKRCTSHSSLLFGTLYAKCPYHVVLYIMQSEGPVLGTDHALECAPDHLRQACAQAGLHVLRGGEARQGRVGHSLFVAAQCHAARACAAGCRRLATAHLRGELCS